MANPKVQTTQGAVVGRLDGRLDPPIEMFLGLPYAAAPIGDRRWRSPVPVEPWTDELICHRPGPAAIQTLREPGGPLPAQNYAISEDCLNLNVYTPHSGSDQSLRPVLFWVHGGSYMRGRGASNDGSHLCRNGDIVVVAINYRMGLLGFIELGDVDSTRAGSHNLGVQDQIAALQWVHDNIAAFGGDPEQVTICGESAGAGSVLAILASPSADGLFHRLISQSAPAGFGPPSKEVAHSFAEGVGARSIDDLLALSTDEILAAQSDLLAAVTSAAGSANPPELPNNSGPSFRPAVDNITLTRDAAAAAADRKIPLLVGTNDDEGSLFSLHLNRSMSIEELHKIAAARVGDKRAHNVVRAYQSEYPDKQPCDIAIQWIGDLRFWTTSLAVADAAAVAGTPVHLYRFSWKSEGFGGRFGAMHALEIPFIWQTPAGWDALFGEDHPEPPELSSQMHHAWINYVRTGDPSHDGIGDWPTYNLETRSTLTFGHTTKVVQDPNQTTRLAWT